MKKPERWDENLTFLGFNKRQQITTELVNKRFRKMSKLCHPDLQQNNQDPATFQKLVDAKNILLDYLKTVDVHETKPASTNNPDCPILSKFLIVYYPLKTFYEGSSFSIQYRRKKLHNFRFQEMFEEIPVIIPPRSYPFIQKFPGLGDESKIGEKSELVLSFKCIQDETWSFIDKDLVSVLYIKPGEKTKTISLPDKTEKEITVPDMFTDGLNLSSYSEGLVKVQFRVALS
jgi:hypothetical protein